MKAIITWVGIILFITLLVFSPSAIALIWVISPSLSNIPITILLSIYTLINIVILVRVFKRNMVDVQEGTKEENQK